MKNSKEWLSVAEILELEADDLPKSDKGIVKKADRENWEKRQREGKNKPQQRYPPLLMLMN